MMPLVSFKTVLSGLIVSFMILGLTACAASRVGKTVISEPDEYSRIYEAKEKYVLRALARVFKEREMGKNVRVDETKKTVESDFVVQDEWRTKTFARVQQVNWKECEVFLTVTTEKKTETGWEMRRLLEKEQYEKVFDALSLRVYQEMYKTE